MMGRSDFVTENEERFDIYDGDMNPLGQASRHEVHAQGLWHQTFHCWILSECEAKPALIFQKRHLDKDTYPGRLDISCAGHLQAGESIQQGSRELEEELGLSVPFEQLIPCGIYRVQNHIRPDLIDREICHVYGILSNQALASYQLQKDELTGLYLIGVEEVYRFLCGANPQGAITAAGVELDAYGMLQEVKQSFTSEDFVPHAPDYYKLVLAGLGMAI
jgi:isopentenyldiphosphate isomerase